MGSVFLLTLVGAIACDASPMAQQALETGPASMAIIGGNLQVGNVDEPLPDPVVVRVLDGGGEPIAGQVVNFRVTAGGGSVLAGAVRTDGEGIAQETWTLGPAAAASQELEARAVDPASGQKQVFATFTAVARDGGSSPEPTQGPADFVEDFEYQSVAAMLSGDNYIDYEVKGSENLSIIEDGYGGSNAVRSTWPASYSGETRLPLDIRRSNGWPGEWWIEYWFRIGSGWSMVDVESWKFMAVVSEGHSWRLEFSNGSDSRGLDQYIAAPYQYNADAHRSMGQLRGSGWHRMRVHFSNAGAGHFDVQIDEDRVVKMRFEPQSGEVYYFSPTGLNRNNGGSGTFSNDVSHLRGYFSDPDWSGF